jgi:hypothetical protein
MAGLCAGGYFYLNAKYSKEKSDLAKQIDSLQADLDKLSSASNSSSTSISTSTSTSTLSGLTSYSNSYCGFSIKYPSTLYLRDYFYDTQTSAQVQKGQFLILSKTKLTDNSYVANADMPTPYFMITCPSEEFGLSGIKSGQKETITDITMAGATGWKNVQNEPSILDESYSTSIYLNHGGKGYQILWKNSDAQGVHDTAIDAIVGSFQFTS